METAREKYTINSRFALVDVETSGTNTEGDRIIEIGILLVENQQLVRSFKSFLDPEEARVSPFIYNLTGIRPSDLEHAPTFSSISSTIENFFIDAVFVAHNARFDYSFLRAEFSRIGVDFKLPTLCSVKLSRSLFPEYRRHNLDEVTSRMGITIENRHRAFDDAKAIWHFLQYIDTKFDRKKVDSKIHELIHHV